MATSKEYITYLVSKLENLGFIRARKMFGEYLVYINDKAIFLVCDNQVFVKINENSKLIFADKASQDYPYPQAKLHYLVDPEDDDFINDITKLLEQLN